MRGDGRVVAVQTENDEAERDAAMQYDIDDSLILWMLSLSPSERLEVAQGFVDSVLELRNAKPI